LFLSLNYFIVEAKGNQVLIARYPVFMAGKETAGDPKPGELTMSRVKLREIGVEARTSVCYKRLG